MTPHIEASKSDIASIVIMPGDPLRAKYIADNFLNNAKLVNSVRNIFAYTGTFKGKNITVMASGMGIPSMGIYCYELYKFYNVEYIIRIGSCGAYLPELNLLDTVLVEKTFSESNFAYTFNNEDCHLVKASQKLNNLIYNTSIKSNIKLPIVNSFCSECFDAYISDVEILLSRMPKDLNIAVAEMEAFSLFYIANYLNKQAACLLTVVDTIHSKQKISPEDRQSSLNNMIILALKTAYEL